MSEHLSQALDEKSKRENQYDERGKYLIAHKECLARIMHECISEYKDCTLEEIQEKYIEGTPDVLAVPVHKNATNTEMIRGANVEDSSLNEGTVRYDIRFYALTPGKDQVEIIINVEVQHQSNTGYPLVKRALYYCARLISSQYEVEFSKSEYNEIKRVYSIWLCMDAEGKGENAITTYAIEERNVVGNVSEQFQDYDLMHAIMIRIGDPDGPNFDGIIKFIGVLLSTERSSQEKKKVLEQDFGLQMSVEMDEEVKRMGSLSSAILEKGIKQGLEQGIEQGIEKGETKKAREISRKLYAGGMPIAQISEIADVSEETVQEWVGLIPTK